MCSNYKPVTLRDRLLAHFGVVRPDDETPTETWPGYNAPFIVRSDDKAEAGETRQALVGQYGLVPAWSKDLLLGRKTYNCRSETAAEKPSFRDAWRKRRWCIVPAEELYEPCWETGRAVRWAVRRIGGPVGVAGLWGMWIDPKTAQRVPTFTMLTVNADDHALYRRFHKPGEEKRMPVILAPEDFDAWLNCTTEDAMGFMKAYPSELLEADPTPLPSRAAADKRLSRANPKSPPPAAPAPESGDLFD
ncbi:SOS response-associated peptidase [Roseateles cellulosilyticus]|uniref:Abasic site processing protein n=1 Tax=Pelomonas cellulosilytica TaxID=2906762 RepID=A0ABS8XW20_9BURK|nr:SOS response-associated peptidase [Pelomonas sp. P8]MCE4556854.1 SOS response-associated peptidase [Pelomonas sp. P8]